MIQKNWFKANSPDDRSGDILVSFSNEWFKRIDGRDISAVFRRRTPRAFTTNRLFIYLGSPASCLVGFANVRELLEIDLNGALALAKQAGLIETDIRNYFSGRDTIGCYRIGEIFLFNKVIPLIKLRKSAGFTPPQSFLFLSKKASHWLDGMPAAPSDMRTTLASPPLQDERASNE